MYNYNRFNIHDTSSLLNECLPTDDRAASTSLLQNLHPKNKNLSIIQCHCSEQFSDVICVMWRLYNNNVMLFVLATIVHHIYYSHFSFSYHFFFHISSLSFITIWPHTHVAHLFYIILKSILIPSHSHSQSLIVFSSAMRLPYIVYKVNNITN